MRFIRHAAFILIPLLVVFGIPALFFADWSALLSGNGVDAVSGASLDVPDTPSGNFYVFMNLDYRHGTTDEWRDFFEEKPVGVIFEDISCLVIPGDASGLQLAERYQARLAENQMTLRSEEGTLLSSKIEAGVFDVVIVSKDVADAVQLHKVFNNDRIMTITISEQAG